MQVTVFCVCDVDQVCDIFQNVFLHDIQTHGVMVYVLCYKFCLHLILVEQPQVILTFLQEDDVLFHQDTTRLHDVCATQDAL